MLPQWSTGVNFPYNNTLSGYHCYLQVTARLHVQHVGPIIIYQPSEDIHRHFLSKFCTGIRILIPVVCGCLQCLSCWRILSFLHVPGRPVMSCMITPGQCIMHHGVPGIISFPTDCDLPIGFVAYEQQRALKVGRSSGSRASKSRTF